MVDKVIPVTQEVERALGRYAGSRKLSNAEKDTVEEGDLG